MRFEHGLREAYGLLVGPQGTQTQLAEFDAVGLYGTGSPGQVLDMLHAIAPLLAPAVLIQGTLQQQGHQIAQAATFV